MTNHNSCCESSSKLEQLCQQSMDSCRSQCFVDTRDCPGICDGSAIAMTEPVTASQVSTERCCDANGCCGLYLRCCRNPYWPEFAHPTWLCCRDLYRQ